MATTAQRTYAGNYVLEPYWEPDLARTRSVQLPASQSLARGLVVSELTGTNEVQRITITGTPTGGTFTVTYGGQTTAAIAYNATAATVQTALRALSSIGGANVAVTGGPGPGTPWDVTFQNALGSTNVAQMTTADSFTGGSSPASAVTTTTAGSAGTPGTYAAYDATATTGAQIPKGLLKYSTETDSSALATFLSSEHGDSYPSAPIFYTGFFATADLVGLTDAAIAAAGWQLVSGTVQNGVVKIG